MLFSTVFLGSGHVPGFWKGAVPRFTSEVREVRVCQRARGRLIGARDCTPGRRVQ